MNKERKKIFIASSSKAIKIADLIKKDLQTLKKEDKRDSPEEYVDYGVTIWSDAKWMRNYSTLDSLLKYIEDYHYAVIIFNDDDKLDSNGTQSHPKYTTRDNVLFEMGLFMGSLGRDSVFILQQSSGENIKILSDLYGINLLEYSVDKNDDAENYDTREASRDIHDAVVSSVTGHAYSNRLIEEAVSVLREVLSEKLDSALTTRFVGNHTSFLKSFITPLIKDSEEKLYIACDYPAYGALTQFKKFKEYLRATENKTYKAATIPDFKLGAKFLNKNLRESLDIFEKTSIRELWNSSEKKDEIVKSLCNDGFGPVESEADLRSAIIKQQDHYEKAFVGAFKAENSKLLDRLLPIHIWLNEKQAVFSFSNLNEEFSEFGFRTSDPELLKALESIWEKY